MAGTVFWTAWATPPYISLFVGSPSRGAPPLSDPLVLLFSNKREHARSMHRRTHPKVHQPVRTFSFYCFSIENGPAWPMHLANQVLKTLNLEPHSSFSACPAVSLTQPSPMAHRTSYPAWSTTHPTPPSLLARQTPYSPSPTYPNIITKHRSPAIPPPIQTHRTP